MEIKNIFKLFLLSLERIYSFLEKYANVDDQNSFFKLRRLEVMIHPLTIAPVLLDLY